MAINIEFNNQPIREFVGILNEANAGLNELKSTGSDIPEGFSDVTQRAQEYSDTIQEATDKSKTFKTNYVSAIGKVGEGFASLNPILGGLDKALGTSLSKNLSVVTGFGEAVAGAARTAQIFASAIFGLVPAITAAGAQVVKFGIQLLANPIFLIATVIIGVVVALGAFLNALGLLQPILDGIQALLQPLIDGFKSLAKFFGLSGDAAATSAKQVADYEAALDSLNRTSTITNAVLERELILAEARGATERELLAIRQKIAAQAKDDALTEQGLNLTRIFQLQKAIDTERLSAKEKLDLEKEVTDLKQKNTEITAKLITDGAKVEAEAIKLTRDEKAKAEADAIKASEAEKAGGEKRTEEQKKQDAAALASLLARLKLEQAAISESSIARLDSLKQQLLDGKITQETFNAERVLNDRQTNEELAKLSSDFVITEKVTNADRLKVEEQLKQNVLDLTRKNLDIDLGLKKQYDAAEVKSTEQTALDKIAAFEKEWLQKKIELLGVEGLKEEELADKLIQLEIDKNKAKLAFLQVGSLEYLALKEQIVNQEIALDKKVTDANTAALAKEKADRLDIQNAALDLGRATFDSLASLSDTYFEDRKARAKGNQAEEEKLARKQFQINKAFQLGTAVINGIQSILAITSTAIDPTGVSTALRIGAQVALNAASIVKIASAKFGGGGSSAVTPPPTPSPGAASTPSLNLFGQANTGNVTAATAATTQTGPGGQLRVIATVSETEITAVQNRNFNYALNSES